MYGLLEWSLFFLLFVLPIILLNLMVYACMKVSSKASRMEEEMNAKKNSIKASMVK